MKQETFEGEVVVVHQLPTRTTFAQLPDGDEVFISSRVSRAANLGLGDRASITYIANNIPDANSRWFALRAHKLYAPVNVEKLLAHLEEGPLTAAQLESLTGYAEGAIAAALEPLHGAGRVSKAVVKSRATQDDSSAMVMWGVRIWDFVFDVDSEGA